MAELTPLDEKLGEVLGLAQAAQDATQKVAKLADDDQIRSRLEQMREEAEETERRTAALIDGLEGKKTAIREKGRETKAEAGELGHWEIVRQMSEKAGESAALELAEWAIPIQKRHRDVVRASSLELAAAEA